MQQVMLKWFVSIVRTGGAQMEIAWYHCLENLYESFASNDQRQLCPPGSMPWGQLINYTPAKWWWWFKVVSQMAWDLCRAADFSCKAKSATTLRQDTAQEKTHDSL